MLSKKAKKHIALGCAAAAGAAFLAAACDMRMTSVQYEIKSEKINTKIRIAFISDLHNSLYGNNQSQLLKAVDDAKPDIVIFGGDIADKTQDCYPANSYIAAEYLAEKYPCYYSMGNHENSRGDSMMIKQALSEYGVKVLEGSGEVLSVNGNEVEICGIYDAHTYDEADGELVNQLEAVTAENDSTRYRILIAHFPEQIDEYARGGFDLVLSGHAHGGQWRIPGVLNGLYAPGQGFFPRYAGGIYHHGDTEHIVSRGLWKPSALIAIPRIFNRPELVFADIVHN